MNAVYIKPAVLSFFLEILYIAYISSFPTPNVADSIAGGLLVKKSMKKCPRTLKTIRYEPTYALRGTTSQSSAAKSTRRLHNAMSPHRAEWGLSAAGGGIV